MRIHRVEKFLGDFEELHASLTSELIILPNFPEGGGLGALLGGQRMPHDAQSIILNHGEKF